MESHNWLSGLWAHTAASCSAFQPPVSPILLNRSALNLSIPQSVLILKISPTQVQDLALGLVELPDVHMAPTSQACHSPFPPANQKHHSACCDPRVHSVPWSSSLMQIINNVGPNVDSGGHLSLRFPLRHWAIDCNCLHVTTQPLLYWSDSPSSNTSI